MASLSPQHIPGCARLGIARLKAFRLNVYEPITHVRINGSDPVTGPGTGLLIEGASIQHVLNDQTDTAAFTARGWTPAAGQRIDVYAHEMSNQLFGGRILETTKRYRGKTTNVEHDLHCVDPTWLLQRTKVLAVYTGQSATAIVLDLVARFARGVTTTHVQAGLPVIDAITFTNENLPTCLSTICQQVGAYWYLDYQSDLHVFTVADQPANPITQAAPGPSSDHALSEDLSQVATRILGLGGGVGAAVDVAPGATTLPVDLGLGQVAWYPSAGGIVQTAAQRLTYTGIKGDSGRGSLLGTGNAPTTAPLVAPAAGTGLVWAWYRWAVTFKTATGETMVGPYTSAPTGGEAPTLTPMQVRPSYWGPADTRYYTPNANIAWRVAVLYYGGVGYSLAESAGFVNLGDRWPELGLGPVKIDPNTGHEYNSWLQSSCPAKILQIQIYRTMPGGGPFYAWTFYNGVVNVSDWLTIYSGNVIESDLPSSPPYPTGPIASFNAVNLTIPKSPSSSVTARVIYRTAANGTALKHLAEVADNTTTTYFDNHADSALTTDPPTIDTSQLREDGQVQVGATSLLVTDPQPFLDDGGASGGWVQLGNLTVRYGGISGNTLTGVPATGTGSVTATVRYGTEVIVQPRLVGVPATGTGSIVVAIRKGDQITLRLELEDQAAALALAQKLGSADYRDGLVEFVVSDSRFGPTELLAHMRATLAERKDPQKTLTYATRDPTHEVGRLVTISLTLPAISGTYRIQRVTFSEIAIGGARAHLAPKRTIEATNKLYTFSDLLRRLRGREGGVP